MRRGREMALTRTGSCVLLPVMFTTVDSLTQEFSVNNPSRNLRNVTLFFILNLIGLERIASVLVAHSFTV